MLRPKRVQLDYLLCAGALHPELPACSDEWIGAPADDELGTDMLFSEADRPEEITEELDIEGLGHLVLRSISRIHRHTLTHTGLMHWESGPALARFILSNPSVFAGKYALN